MSSLLRAWSNGESAALEQLTPIVLSELKRIARRYMARERKEHTLQPTALVNEAFLRLVDTRDVQWQDRTHFFAIAAQMMRRILVNHALARGARKRGGGLHQVSLNDAIAVSSARDAELVDLDEALNALAVFDSRKARVVELRFFGGLDAKETAAMLHVSPQTVLRDWTLAKAWLLREMARSGELPAGE